MFETGLFFNPQDGLVRIRIPPGSISPANFYQFFVADLEVMWSDQANDMANWTKINGWDTTSGKYVSSPTSFTDSPGGNYPPNTLAALICNNQFQPVNALKTFLEFDTQWAMEYGFDYAWIEIITDNGSTWTALSGQYTYLGRIPPGFNYFKPIYGGVQPTWVHEIIDISDYVNNPFNFRYKLKSDQLICMDGWYIDNIKISKCGITDVEDSGLLPSEFAIGQNFPNPFNPSTTISWQLATGSDATLKVYDILGREITTLADEYRAARKYKTVFNASSLPSGVYFYQLKAGDFVQTRKMILMK